MNRSETDYKPSFGMPRKELPTIKRRLYEIAGGKCQYSEGCDKTDINQLTIDHIISKRIARFLGWKKRQVNDFKNLQLLCWPHHLLKDQENANKTKEEITQINLGIAA